MNQAPANLVCNRGKGVWPFANEIESMVNLRQELLAQALSLLAVPRRCGLEVGGRLPAEADLHLQQPLQAVPELVPGNVLRVGIGQSLLDHP